MWKWFTLTVCLLLLASPAYALWADPPTMCNVGAGVYCPSVTQPSITNDLVGFRLQNPTGSSIPQGYVTFGQVFLPGTVAASDTLIARIGGTSRYLQMDVQSTWPDASVRHAGLTYNTQAAIAASATTDVMYAKCPSGCPSAPTAAPTAAALIGGGYDVTATFTWHMPALTTETIHANACLTNASTPVLLNGAAAKEYHAGNGLPNSGICTVGGGLLKVEFDIRAYSDGSVQTDVIVDNTWFLQGSKRNDLNYDISMSDGYTQTNIAHTLYGRWHHLVNSTTTFNLNPQYDHPYLIATGAVPLIDTSRGVSEFGIIGRSNCSWPGYLCISTNPGQSKPMSGTGTITPQFNDGGGGRQDLGEQPNWYSVWLLTQDYRAYQWMLTNGDVFGSIQFHFTDEATGHPIDMGWVPYKYPSIWYGWAYPNTTPAAFNNVCDHSGNLVGCGPNFANGEPTLIGPVWTVSSDHLTEASFLPWVLTVRNYYLMDLQGETVAAMALTPGMDVGCTPQCSATNYYLWGGKNGDSEPSLSYANEMRSDLPILRAVAEAAAFTPDSDPLKATFVWYLQKGIAGTQQGYVVNDDMAQFGQMRGFYNEVSIGNAHNHWQQVGYWDDYFTWALNAVIRMNVDATTTSKAKDIVAYNSRVQTGPVIAGDMGYDPFQCCGYWKPTYNPSTGRLYATTWGLAFQNSMVFNNAGCPSGVRVEPPALTAFTNGGCADNGGLPPIENASQMMLGYPLTRAAAMADAISALGTSDPQLWRTFAFTKAWVWDAFNTLGTNPLNTNDPGSSFTEGWPVLPLNLMAARMPSGDILYDANTIVNTTTGTVTVSPANSALPAMLACIKSTACTLNGGTGSTDVYLGSQSGTTTINIGTGNGMAFAAWNAAGTTTFVDNTGNNVMYGSAGSGANVFDFEVSTSGQDTIWNFRPGTDTLRVKRNLNGNNITTVTGLIAAATVNGNDVVFNLGGGNKITVKRGYAASNFTSSIAMAP